MGLERQFKGMEHMPCLCEVMSVILTMQGPSQHCLASLPQHSQALTSTQCSGPHQTMYHDSGYWVPT